MFRRIIKWLSVSALALIVTGGAITGGLYLYLAPGLPDPAELANVQLQQPLRIYASNGDLMATYGAKRRRPVDLEEVPRSLRNAFLAAEDNRFYDHPGVDWMGIVRASWNLMLTGEKSQGGSTITMQVARNFFLSADKTYIRKIREIFLALEISRELTKDEVLELYLNKIYLGEGTYGIAAAARNYYGKPIGELDLAEMAMIAGLPRAPSWLNPIDHPERARWRRNYVLRQMHENGMIDAEALERALAEPVVATDHETPVELEAPYVAEMARRMTVERFGESVYTRGYSVYTTVAPDEQRAAVDALRQGLVEYERRQGYSGPVARVDEDRLPGVDRVRQLRKLAGTAAGSRAPEPGQPPILELGTLNPQGIDTILAEHDAAGNLDSALVLAVMDDRAIVYRYEDGLARLPWSAVQWVADARAPVNTAQAVDGVRDVVEAGDVIHVTGDPERPAVRLAQRPEVQGAFVALDPDDGAIRALVGGFDYSQSQFNRATRAYRQPGSNFKPFVYSAALNRGFTAATLVNDAPVVSEEPAIEGTWRPQNYSGRIFGPTRLREGLVYSRNLVSIRVLREIGIPYAIDYLRRFGFPADRLPRNLTLALGSASVTPLQLARGYAVFANMGYRVAPYAVTRIVAPDGSAAYRADPAVVCEPSCDDPGARDDAGEAVLAERNGEIAQSRTGGDSGRGGAAEVRSAPRAIDRRNAYLIRSFLRDVARRGTGRGTRVLGRDDIGVKTGTTDENHDAWFSGFTSSVVATAWVGYDRLRSLGPGETGARAAMPIWIDFMREALAGTPERWPPMPSGVVSVRIDPETGAYAAPGNDRAVFELFRSGNAPEPKRDGTDSRPARLF